MTRSPPGSAALADRFAAGIVGLHVEGETPTVMIAVSVPERDTIVRALRASAQAAQDQQLRDALREAERVRDEWCAEYVAIRDALPQAAPAGYVLIPIEPPREMWAACGDAVVGKTAVHHDVVVEAVYKAIVATALSRPQCPTCGGRREVGGFVSAESGYQTDPCPDCSAHSSQKQE